MAKDETNILINPADIVPSLGEVLREKKLDLTKITVGLTGGKPGEATIPDRHEVMLFDGKLPAAWQAPSLRELFRGNKQAPDLSRYPVEYVPIFYFIERHAVLVEKVAGGLRDREFEELYSALRRRPDGKSLTMAHSYLWQVLATLLGLRPISEAQYEAVLGQLEASCRHFQMGPTSSNYVNYLKGGPSLAER